MHTAHVPPPSYYRHIQHSLHAFDHNHFTADLQILTLMPRLLLCFAAAERKDSSVRNFSNRFSQKQKKTNTWSVALSHHETGSDLWLRIMGRSVQPSALMHVCVHMRVCVMGVWVGVNVTANLLTFPKACIPPPRETDPDRRCYDNGTLVSLSPWGAYGGVGGGPALTCWPRAVWNTEPQMGSLTKTNEIKKNKRRKEAQTEKQKSRAIAAEGKFIVLCESVHSI